MKKVFLILSLIALTFSLVACSSVLEGSLKQTELPTTEATVVATTKATAASTTAPTTAPTLAPTSKPTTAPTTVPATKPTTAPTTVPTIPAETVRAHSWKAATCTEPKTCTTCGATEGQANGHSWKEATYSAPKTCTACNTVEGDALEKPSGANYHGHIYTGGEYSKKFHYKANCAGKYSHEITWEEVDRRNLGPCGTCVLK